MRVIYQAENAIDANLVKGLLEQVGIMSFVSGEFLQGGVGDLPADGFITVSVADPDVEAGTKVVTEFKNNTLSDSSERETRWEFDDRLTDWKG